ncbi:ABC transporter permease [Candidatus Saccharibacteria bacterium]|nr:ABC transporter permease [Candidatus Saccharibacteria bacterium]
MSISPKRYIFTTWTLSVMFTRRYFRSRTALFFSILFPLILLFIFGGIFGSSSGTTFNIAVIDQAHTDFSKTFTTELGHASVFKVKPASSLTDAKDQLQHSSIDSIIVLPAGFGAVSATTHYPSGEAQVLYDPSNATAGQTIGSVMGSILDKTNSQITGIQPPLTVTTVSSGTSGLTSFDYEFTGLLGFSLLGIGIFGPINTLPALKKTGALQRFRTTPLRPLQFIIAYMVSSLAAGAVSIAIQFLVAVTVFKFHMHGSLLIFVLFTLFAAIMIFGFGMAVGGWANDEKQSAPLGNLVTFPMMFLSGVFFPVFLMPIWLQKISAFIPLTPAIDGMRMIATQGKTFIDLGPQLAIMGAWTILIYFLAFKLFRWE